MRRLRAVIAVVTVMYAEPAWADGAVSSEDAASAQRRVEEGTRLYALQQYAKAAEEYRVAYELDPRPEYLYATAQAQRLAGDCAAAAESYREYLQTDPAAGERERAEKNLARCKAELAVPKPRAVQAVDTEAPEELESAPPAGPEGSTRSYLVGHVLVGAGVAALAGGALLFQNGRRTINAHNAATTYDAFSTSHATIDSAHTKQTLGIVAMAAGGGLIASGVLFYALRARSSHETQVSAQVSQGSALVTLAGSF